MHIRKYWGLLFLLVVGLTLAGCVAEGYNQPPVSTVAQSQKTYPSENLLVVIRYPALYDHRKDSSFEWAYKKYILSKDPRPPRTDRYPTPFKNSLIKTNYYVMELFDALRRQLPEHTVALQPQRLKIRNRRIIPEVGFSMPPAAIYVDFLTYVYSHKLITSDSNTFGQFISPLVNVRTAPRAA